jgi:hypothetical protein
LLATHTGSAGDRSKRFVWAAHGFFSGSGRVSAANGPSSLPRRTLLYLKRIFAG